MSCRQNISRTQKTKHPVRFSIGHFNTPGQRSPEGLPVLSSLGEAGQSSLYGWISTITGSQSLDTFSSWTLTNKDILI